MWDVTLATVEKDLMDRAKTPIPLAVGDSGGVARRSWAKPRGGRQQRAAAQVMRFVKVVKSFNSI
jgi:hypothetical protein